MKRDLATVAIPFPKGLMSTARSVLSMPVTMGREVRNALMSTDGAGSKRNGVVAFGPALAGEVITAVMSFTALAGQQLMVATDAGKIYRLDGGAWVQVWSGLNGAGVVRTVVFDGRLLLCNGVDDLLAWDGTSWSVVRRFVDDAATGLTYVNATTFKINSDAGLYAVGNPVRAVVAGVEVTSTVASVSVAGAVVTVVLAASVLASTLTKVAFSVKPPKMAGLVAVHDRLWGFGKGVLSAGMSGDVDRLRVYYTYGVNDYAAWPDPETGIIPSLNLADKAGLSDELMAMSVKDGMTVFIGRNHLQLWTGSSPGANGDFAWAKTIPLGVVHGNAVLELPNDLLFVSRQGARTLSRTLQTEQLDVSDVGSELDPTITALVSKVMAAPALYKRVVGMRHDGQGWFGLAMDDCTLVWQVGAFGHGWVVFDGVFAGVTAAHSAPDGELYIAKGGMLYRYSLETWSDDGHLLPCGGGCRG
ncbi:MAG: hypothetical protein DI585_05560 [Pseudomonas fluorescens]|nr:MAG: hypothetical protein DI585_05560 [Pseudomonas fluorescens]